MSKQTIDALAQAWERGWAPHDRRPHYEWARENVILPNAYAIQGAFHVEKSRYLIEPFNAIADDLVRTVTVRAGIQTGKSLLGDITACWTIVNRPQHFLWNFPTDDAAERYAERRAVPLLEACPEIAKRLAKIHRHKKKKNEIHFGSMWMVLQGANEGNLQSYSVPMTINEEVWQWKEGMLVQAKGRLSFFSWRSKEINISQAGHLGHDLNLAYEAGSQEVHEIACRECRAYQPLLWNYRMPEFRHDGSPIYAGMTWDTNDKTRPGGVWHFDRVKESARYVCIKCLHPMEDEPTLRRMLNDHSRPRAMNPSASKENRSFSWNSMACDEVRWGTLIEEYLRAKDQEKIGNSILLEEFYLKRLAIPYDPRAHSTFDLLPTIEIEKKDTGTGWEKADYTFIGVDVQSDCMWVLVVAWSKDGEDMVLHAEKVTTWQQIADIQARFLVKNHCVFVDCGYRKSEVWRECVRHGEVVGDAWQCWTAVMGDSRDSFIYVPTRGPNRGQRIRLPYSYPPSKADPCIGLQRDHEDMKLQGKRCYVIAFAKGMIDQMAGERREMMKRRQMSYVSPGDWNEEFSRQMEGEQLVTLTSPLGHQRSAWKMVGPNHLLDCYRICIMAACMAEIIGPSKD